MAEKTIVERLTDLYKLQSINSELDQISVLQGELPMEVADLEDEIKGLEKRIGRLEDSVQEYEDKIAGFRNKIKESETLITRYNQQLDEVKNNREYEALSKEIELQNLDIQLAEKRIRETSANIEGKKETLGAALERRDVKLKDLDLKKVELEKIITKTEKEEKKLGKQADKQRKLIEERLLKAYDKIRTSYRNGLAVVPVERSACGGCFNQIPPQTQLEISLMKKIIACEHCGRVLVDTSIVNDVLGITPVEE